MKRERNERATNNYLAVSQCIRNTGATQIVLLLFVLLFAQTRINAQAPPNFMSCAREGEPCVFEGTKEVRYGAGAGWVTKTATNTILCGVAAFGRDPAPNVLKQCYIPYAGSPERNPKFTPCAKEGEHCQFAGTKEVMYGAGDNWSTRTATNGIRCSVRIYGDPAPNVHKQCFVASPRVFPETYSAPLTLKAPVKNPVLMIDNFVSQQVTASSEIVLLNNQTKPDKALEFVINNIPDKHLGAVDAIAHLVLRPKAVYSNGLLQIYLTTSDSSVDISQQNYANTNQNRGFYLESLETTISADNTLYERRNWGPQNQNEKGDLTDMSSITLGAKLDSSSYTVGTSFGRSVPEFKFRDESNAALGVVKGTWKLSEQFGNLLEKDSFGQFNGLKEPPALASSNFPVYAQVVLKSRTQSFKPETITFDIKLKVKFKRTFLETKEDGATGRPIITWIFTPAFYKGELYKRVGTQSQETEVNYKLTLDLKPLYQ